MFTRDQLNSLYRYCIALTGDESDSYDLLQSSIEKYLKVEREDVTNLQVYMRTIIRNQYIDEYRRNSKYRSEEYDESVAYIDTDTESLEMMVATQSQIESIWQKLSAVEREIIYFWAIEGYTTKELAEFLGMPKGTLLSKIHRLRKRLEHQLGDSERESML